MAEIKEKHLEIVQGVVNRLAYNSFFIKGWAITLLTGLMAVYAASGDKVFIILAIVPILLFWFLDSYYLWQERLFRRLYAEIVAGSYPSDFSINIEKINKSDISYIGVVFSKTIFPLYFIIILLLVIIYLWLCYA